MNLSSSRVLLLLVSMALLGVTLSKGFYNLQVKLIVIVIYVDSSVAPGGDGLTPATAFSNITSGIAASAANDTISVAAGVYNKGTGTTVGGNYYGNVGEAIANFGTGSLLGGVGIVDLTWRKFGIFDGIELARESGILIADRRKCHLNCCVWLNMLVWFVTWL